MSSVQQFYDSLQTIDLKDPKAREIMMKTIEQYDQNFQQQHSFPTPQQLSETYKKDNSKITLPTNGSEVEKQLKSQFIADGSIFGEYQQLLRQSKVPEYIIPPPPPPKPEEHIANIFLKNPYNYLDQNANSKTFCNQIPSSQGINQNIQGAINLNNDQKLNLQMQINSNPTNTDADFLTRIKKTVNVLGGIEDTVQIMKQSLQDYEQQHQIQNKIEQQPIFKDSTLIQMNHQKVLYNHNK